MLATCEDGPLGIRDRALLLIGFAGAFRRSELTSLDVADLDFIGNGMTIRLRRSKTDQEGRGETVGIPWGANRETCPVLALQAWLDTAAITTGPIFRPIDRHGNIRPQRLSDRAVALIVKRHAEAAGLDAAKYSGHSLRAGLATSAAMGGASERAIMRQTRHRSLPMVRRYIREGDLFRENAAAQVGL
jgi:integrase